MAYCVGVHPIHGALSRRELNKIKQDLFIYNEIVHQYTKYKEK